MVDQSGGTEPHRDPPPGREDRGAARAPGGLGEVGRVQRPLLAGEEEYSRILMDESSLFATLVLLLHRFSHLSIPAIRHLKPTLPQNSHFLIPVVPERSLS